MYNGSNANEISDRLHDSLYIAGEFTKHVSKTKCVLRGNSDRKPAFEMAKKILGGFAIFTIVQFKLYKQDEVVLSVNEYCARSADTNGEFPTVESLVKFMYDALAKSEQEYYVYEPLSKYYFDASDELPEIMDEWSSLSPSCLSSSTAATTTTRTSPRHSSC